MFYKDSYGYSRNRAVGMSYLNRMLIEEESQFECDGVYEIDSQFDHKCMLHKISKQQSDSITRHIILAGEPLSFQYFFVCWWDRIPGFKVSHADRNRYQADPALQNLNVMVTLLESERLECVQKQKAKRFYSEGGQIRNVINESMYGHSRFSNDPSLILEVHKSTGDDIEDFFKRIEEGQIVPNYLDKNLPRLGEVDDFFSGLWETRTHWNEKQYVHNFHLSMLTEEEENSLKSRECLNAHFKFKTILHQHEMNFSLSVCLRRTFILQGEFLYGTKEPDPWQLRIMKNYQADPPRKIVESYDYIPDSDASDYISDSD